MASYLIKNGKVSKSGQKTVKECDLLLENGKIDKIGKNLKPGKAHIIEARGKLIFPGFLDIHAHFRDPGREDEEDIESGCQAAIAGGYTGVAIMPNTIPVLDNLSVLQYINDKANNCKINIYPVAAQTVGLKGECLTEMVELAENGAVGFSDDGHCVQNSRVMRRVMEYAKIVNLPLIIHAEDESLSGDGLINEGFYSTTLGLHGIPYTAESSIIGRDLLLAELVGGIRIHFTHISSARSVDLIRQAKKDGLPVTCDVTPHHLVLTEEVLVGYDSLYKVNPPLRSQEDMKALRKGLLDGTIDAIGTDHAPHALHEKEREFDYAPFGMIGLETAFPVLYTELVLTGVVPLELLIEKMTTGPASILSQKKSMVQEGENIDLIIVEPDLKFTINADKFYSKSLNSPFQGREVQGKVTDVLKDKSYLFKEGAIR